MTTELRVDPLISLIIPVYSVPKAVFKRCLMSLTKQDYENKEIILSFDGPNPTLMEVALPFANEFKYIKIIEHPHVGACETRNIGFRESKGEIVSFFDSDYVANPGMLRMWVDNLLDHPECGFVYGGYEYAVSSRNVYWSKPFDEFELEQANYIDAGFPLWRKYAVEWDSSVKSLQDWDFWLRVVKTHKVKGFYIERDISYTVEPPRPGGLSYDSHENWVSRVRHVREKNGIKSSDLVVTSIGATYHAREIAKMIGADYRDGSTILKPHAYKGVYLIGFYLKPNDRSNMHPDIMKNFISDSKIIHFVGADIHWLKSFTVRDLKMLSNAINSVEGVLSENQLAHDELEELGIHSKIVPIPPYNDYEVKPLPEKFSVAVYLTNHSDFDKYCQRETLSIVRALPHIQFNAYGDAGKDVAYPNMKHWGNMPKEEWKEFVYKNSCYLRLVRHDTRPMATDEFMIAGRRVITNIPNNGTDYISTKGEERNGEWDVFQTGLNDYYWPKTKKNIVKKILEVRNSPYSDEVRTAISKEVSELLDKEKYKKTIYSLVDKKKPVEELVTA